MPKEDPAFSVFFRAFSSPRCSPFGATCGPFLPGLFLSPLFSIRRNGARLSPSDLVDPTV
jgi:hypothetical protein